MTLPQTLADVLRDLADRLDPYQAPVPVLPKPGDQITVVVGGDNERYEVHGVVNVAWSDASGQAITRLVLREVHQHGWLHDPAEVAALRDAIEQVRNLHGGPHRCPGHLMHDVGPCRTLAALPPTGGAR